MLCRVFPRFLAAIVGASALVACSRDPAPHAPPAAPVTVVKATTKDMPLLASAVGSVEPINSVAVKSLIDGQILESLVKDGRRQAESIVVPHRSASGRSCPETGAGGAGQGRGDARASTLAGAALRGDRRKGLHLGRPDGAEPHE